MPAVTRLTSIRGAWAPTPSTVSANSRLDLTMATSGRPNTVAMASPMPERRTYHRRMSDQLAAPDEPVVAGAKPDKKKAFIAIGIAVAVAVIVFGVILPQIVDWDMVFDVLRSVPGWELAVIFGLGVLRYVPAGWIYALVLPGLSLKQGTQAWVATSGVGSTLPGFDLVLRVAMYRSWGFPIERAMSGMFLSGLVEMSTKLFIAVMAVLLWGLVTLDVNALAIGAIALAVLAVLAGLVATILRSEDRARKFGGLVERVVKWSYSKFERQAPEGLVDRVLSVRLEARDVLGNRWPRAFLAAFIGQALIYTILLLSIRAVGIDDSVLSWADVLVAYAITTIVTSIPITPGGVGIASLTLIAVFTAIAGREVADLAAAGVIIYRIATWLITIPIGWGATLRWQTTSGEQLFGGADEPEPSAAGTR